MNPLRPSILSQAVFLALLGLIASPLAMAAADSADDAGAPRRESDKPNKLGTIKVIGRGEETSRITGSNQVVGIEDIETSRAISVNEALRKIPGLVVRDEEGFGLRPNIGIRGQNPTRSTKTMLLEDGIPASYAPYGDNATYYHAPIQRYDRIEVLKGVEMLRFGPHSISGTINYMTPESADSTEGSLELVGGSRGFASARAHVSGMGLRGDVSHKQGDGSRDNTHLEQSDVFLKFQKQLNDKHILAARLNFLREDSQVSYTGITDAEYRHFGRFYNPFENDHFDIEHRAFSATHQWLPTTEDTLSTTAYYTNFSRDWWRQASTTTDTQCGSAFRDARFAGQAINPSTCNSAQGRLRDYSTQGIEPRWLHHAGWFGADAELELGARWHRETQDRRQVNASSATGRTGTLSENNHRDATAWSAFAVQKYSWNQLSLTGAVRHEAVSYERHNALNQRGGESYLNETMAGLGAAWRFNSMFQVFANVHEGFAPPRTEDLINNNGVAVEVDAEHSINSELGLRGQGHWLKYSAAYFHNNFDNQVLVGSIAGGSTPVAQGEALYEGLELQFKLNHHALVNREHDWFANLAFTQLFTAEQRSTFVAAESGNPIAGTREGNRLPYAPKQVANLQIGYAHGPWDASLDVNHVSAQFSDFANTVAINPNGNGQIGRIAGHTTVGLTANYWPDDANWNAYLSVKNLTDREYISDRTRGILFGNPRQFVVGWNYRW